VRIERCTARRVHGGRLRLRSTRLTAGAAGAWVALALSLTAVSGEIPAPPRAVQLLAAVAAALSIAEAVRTGLGVWRGPIITSFPRRDAVLCDPPGAEAIRSGAQLRGTMGGAGHVFPARLVFPTIAWAAAAASAAALVRDPSIRSAPVGMLAVLAAAIAATLLVPARPFFYREVTGGRVLVYPPAACTRLLEAAAASGALARSPEIAGALAGGDGGWVSSRTPLEPRGNSPRPDPAQHP
jgi:hypothetical protein